MIWIPNMAQLMRLHTKVAERSGGSDAVRDAGLVESALMRASAGFGDCDLYATAEEKAAAIASGLIANHGFIDGNKRIGVAAMLLILRKNNVEISFTQQELICFGLDAAKGLMTTQDVLDWIVRHKVN